MATILGSTRCQHVVSQLARCALVAGMLGILVPAVGAATTPCRVTNLSTGHTYSGTGSNLQDAIDAASAGTKLRIKGICAGNFTIAKNLKLVGKPIAAYPLPTLNGGGSGTVLTITGGSTKVSLTKLTVTNGNNTVSNCLCGGGITNAGTLTLKQLQRHEQQCD